MPFPPVPPALLAALEVVFPATNPRPPDSIETIMYRAGARSVVEFLKEHLTKQQKPGKPAAIIPFPT